MTYGEKYTKERIEAQAKHWLLRLHSGDMSSLDQQAFERWYQQDSTHQQEYARLSVFWQELDLIAEEVLADYGQDSHPVAAPGPASASMHWPLRPVAWIAASLLLIMVLFGAQQLTWSTANSIIEEYSSAKGELRKIVLDDGSTLELGPYSRVKVEFDERQRLVFLHSGEAYFRVAKEPQRPFIVKTLYGHSRAVGTEFEVRIGVERVSVTVHEGIVEVAVKGRSQEVSKSHLRIGQSVSYGNNGRLSAVHDVALALSAVWRNGSMVFEQQPLLEVVEELNRYSRKSIVIGDERLKTIKVNGIFQGGEVDAVLGAIEASLPAELVHGENRITLRYKPASRG